jgi:RecJ-like exonuclease
MSNPVPYLTYSPEPSIMCNMCNGSGEGMVDGTICSTCKGDGEVANDETEQTVYLDFAPDKKLANKFESSKMTCSSCGKEFEDGEHAHFFENDLFCAECFADVNNPSER